MPRIAIRRMLYGVESGGAEGLKPADGAKGLVLTYVADIRGQAIWLIPSTSRRGAQNLPQDTAEKIERLKYSKGIASFEDQKINSDPTQTLRLSNLPLR